MSWHPQLEAPTQLLNIQVTHQHYLEVEYNSKTLEDIESNAEEEETSDHEADPMHMTPVTPPPDYSSPEDDDDPEETDYLEITRAATSK